MEWEQMNDVVNEEKRNGNPIASMISALHLDTNSMYILLPKFTTKGDEEKESKQSEQQPVKPLTKKEKKSLKKGKNKHGKAANEEKERARSSPFHRVKIDLGLTAFQNARAYYECMKKTKSKTNKAKEAAVKMTKEAEKKTNQQIEKQKINISRTIIREARQILWFEKFKWFISSENYLVISGRDAQQNELLVKKYLRTGDVYVHADIHGASRYVAALFFCVVFCHNHRPLFLLCSFVWHNFNFKSKSIPYEHPSFFFCCLTVASCETSNTPCPSHP